jgi:DNA-binding response OmpR family regulator
MRINGNPEWVDTNGKRAVTERTIGRPILLVEDDADDESWVRYAFAGAKIKNPLQVVRNGDEAIRYLGGEGEYGNRKAHPVPLFVLLDLTLPGKSGFEVLQWIKARPEWTSLPVIVLSGMTDLGQVGRAYQYGALTFILKPLRAEELSVRFCRLKGFRFGMNAEGERYIEVNEQAIL